METIITVFTVLSMYLNAASSNNSEFYYNADIEDGIVKTMYVYTHEGDQLKNKLACHFAYDAQGRLTEKTVCHWSNWKSDYVPEYRLQFTYTDNGYELSHSDWSRKEQAWKDVDQKAIYSFSMDELVSVNYLRRDRQGEFQRIEDLCIANPFYEMLLAAK